MVDQYISKSEFMLALPSVIIGVSILSLPTSVAEMTSFSDGWLSILIAGIIATIIALLAVRVASYFPGKPFLEYVSILVTRPVAIFISSVYIINAILLCAATVRSTAFIAQQYLFERTPLEVLALVFLLVVIYGVAGSRIGLFRLNMLFFPIIFIVFLAVGGLNIKWMDSANFFPLFKTSITGHIAGVKEAFTAFSGIGIGLFYVFMIKEPFHMTKKVLTGMGITIFFYIFIFISAIGVFSNDVTSNLQLPTLELALKVDIPGAIFERVDAFVYTIWIMAIFNTITILYDISILLLISIFKKLSKIVAIIIIGPIIFFIGMFPKSMDIVNMLIHDLSGLSTLFTAMVIILLYTVIKWKGIPRHESI